MGRPRKTAKKSKAKVEALVESEPIVESVEEVVIVESSTEAEDLTLEPEGEVEVKEPFYADKTPNSPAILVVENVEAEPLEADLPVFKPLEKDTEAFVPMVALVDKVRKIGPHRYIMEAGKDIRGGVLRAHVRMLQEFGQAKLR